MTNSQITLIQIDNYGPWTVTPNPRREVDLQTLQSRLYADLSQLFGMKKGYVFFSRFDNMIAVTNGIDLEYHALVQESVCNRYPVTISLSVAYDPQPANALGRATEQLQTTGSAQDSERMQVLTGDLIKENERTNKDIQIAHFDVNDATGKYTDKLNEYDAFIQIEHGYAELMKYMRKEHESLSFFVGGDNVITVCSDLKEKDYENAIGHVQSEVDVELKVGIGNGKTSQEAGMLAKHALEKCREDLTRIEYG